VGSFTLASAKVLEIQHRVNTTRNTNGWGSATSWGTEVYTVAQFWKRA
jgi:chemotaxis methyl-accepting protein methylase